MPNAAQLKPSEHLMALFLGKSGSGKTPQACSFPGRTYVFSFDHRMAGLLGCASFIDLSKVDYDEFYPLDAWPAIEKKMDIFKIQSAQGTLPYQNIVVDSAFTFTLAMAYYSKQIRGAGKGSRFIGKFPMLTPEDYNIVSQSFHVLVYDYLQRLKCNTIMTGWIVDRWGKPKVTVGDKEVDDPDKIYADKEVIGEKMLLNDKLAESIPGYFDEVYKFDKEVDATGREKYTVQFRGDMARTTRKELPKGEVEITNKNFAEVWKGFVGPKVEVKV